MVRIGMKKFDPKSQGVSDHYKHTRKEDTIIHWHRLSLVEATWKYLEIMKKQFPSYYFKDNASL